MVGFPARLAQRLSAKYLSTNRRRLEFYLGLPAVTLARIIAAVQLFQ
jgi:hypothetical protein